MVRHFPLSCFGVKGKRSFDVVLCMSVIKARADPDNTFHMLTYLTGCSWIQKISVHAFILEFEDLIYQSAI